jgi:hypothetical protein
MRSLRSASRASFRCQRPCSRVSYGLECVAGDREVGPRLHGIEVILRTGVLP